MRLRWPKTWEDRLWYGLLWWNLAVLVYLVFRTPSADARLLYRATLVFDVVAFLWNFGNAVWLLIQKWRHRKDEGTEATAEPAATTVDG